MLRRSCLVLSLSGLLVLGACATGGMTKSDKKVEKPQASEATVVFMRPSIFGAAISAAVYDVTGNESRFIGIVGSSNKLAYNVAPGEHTFMVVSEAADFMKATVQPGKTYYALVSPRPGGLRARFSFKPLRQQDLDGKEFPQWNSGTQLVENSTKSLEWAANNAPSVNSKRASYWAEWQSKAQDQRDSQTMNAEDGR